MLTKDGVSKYFPIHKLVLAAFDGLPQQGRRVRHIDGNSLNNTLTNLAWGARSKNSGSVKGPSTLHELKQALRYDPNTGCFYWRIQTHGKGRRIYPGTLAGMLRKNGYIQVGFAGQKYRANHLAWFFMTGYWPPRRLIVEHYNSNKADNRWANLFAVPQAKNQQNLNDGLQKNNRSGCRGVHPLQTGRWHARIAVNKRVILLGVYATLEQAIAARKAAEQQYFTGHPEALDFKLRAVLGKNYTLRQVPVVRPAGVSLLVKQT